MVRALAAAVIGLAVSVPAADAQGLTPLGPPLQATTPLAADAGAESPAIEYSPRSDVFVLARQVTRGQDRVVLTTALDRAGRALRPGENVQGTSLGDLSDAASAPRVAYDSTADGFLVTWTGHSKEAGVQAGDQEVFARRLDAVGRPVGAVIRVSSMGPDAVPHGGWTAEAADVAYHPGRGEYTVVWDGTDERPGSESPWDCEVYGQRLDRSGAAVGEDDFQISSMWPPEASSGCGPSQPRVAHQPANGEHIVVWWGFLPIDPYPKRIDGAWGQRLGPTGSKLGGPVLLTDPSQKEGYGGDVVANGVDGEYLVAWTEVYPYSIRGRRLDAALRPLGPELAIIPPPPYSTSAPVLSFDPWRRHYVAATYLGNPEGWWREIFAVALDVSGNPIGPRIQVSESPDPWPDEPLRSQVLPTGPAIAPVPPDGEHMIVWSGADPEPPLAPMREIGSRRLRDPSAGAAPPRGRGDRLRALAMRQAGGAIRRSRLSPGNGLVVYERVGRRRVLRPLRRRELIGVMACRRARQCRLRVVTAIRGRRASRRISVASGATKRLYLRLTARQRNALRRVGQARVTITLRFGDRKRTATLRVRA